MIIYNIEKFMIEQMFKPYASEYINQSDIYLLDEKSKENIIKNRIKEYENELKNKIEKDVMVLEKIYLNNPKLGELVFKRLSKLDIEFYFWIECPFVDWVEEKLRKY